MNSSISNGMMSQNGSRVGQNIINHEMKSTRMEENRSTAYQKDIAQFFIRFKSIEAILLVMEKNHPNERFTKQQIQQTVQQLVTIGLKKVSKLRKDYYNVHPRIPLINMNESLTKILLKEEKTANVRVALVQALFEKTLSPDRTYELADMVNRSLSEYM